MQKLRLAAVVTLSLLAFGCRNASAPMPVAGATPQAPTPKVDTKARVRELWQKGADAKHAGDREAARAHWTEALAVDPHNKAIAEAIEKLDAKPTVELLRYRVVPFLAHALDGERLPSQMVLVDWKNTGEVEVRAVYAAIRAYDEEGRPSTWNSSDTCIWAVEDGKPGIAPGQTYRESAPSGYVLIVRPGVPGFERSTKVEVEITRAK